MKNSIKTQTNELLKLLSEELDISDSKYEEAENHYKSVAEWLDREESGVKDFEPDIYPQGSFRLGTVIKPITEEGEYDIDSVCKLDLTTESCSQKLLKELVGREIKAYAKHYSMDKPAREGNRCWTLEYADGSKFHMDILPAIPNAKLFKSRLEKHGATSEWIDDAISITDRNHDSYSVRSRDWPVSNPKGYAKWFRSQMEVVSTRKFEKTAMLSEKYASVEEVPTYKLKTPLQHGVQIMKRHRDIMFKDSEDKPISIIITTLAAQAYKNEGDMIEAFQNIVDGMLDHIKTRNGVKWVANPVYPLENFADKWEKELRKEKAFYEWHEKLQQDLNKLLSEEGGLHKFANNLNEMVGNNTADRIMEHYGESMRKSRESGTLKATKKIATLGAVIGTTVKGHSFYGS